MATQADGLLPVAGHDATVLILGSFPGQLSLQLREYYAQPRNAFWIIMGELFGAGRNVPYKGRLRLLKAARVALWDVAHTCTRPGSLDSDIQDVRPNDFTKFFRNHLQIRVVLFNGKKAESLYRRHVLPGLPPESQDLLLRRLPSTSPANTTMTQAGKLRSWRAVRRFLEQL